MFWPPGTLITRMVRFSTMAHLWMFLTLLLGAGVVFLQPKKITNEMVEGTSVNRAQGSIPIKFHSKSMFLTPPLPSFKAGF
jgi:hypothetical protein